MFEKIWVGQRQRKTNKGRRKHHAHNVTFTIFPSALQ